ncbi:MAG: glycyl-radical enzyme activating protein [Kiritimatiellales bacterium]|nr:glycyl-radical enzyme activating protein [Kiritimatiellales bacterium]
MKSTTGTIFAIKRYAIHDGPNIRTTVFFKGCPLRCTWCHNPEGLESSIEVVTLSGKCIGCGECITACPEKALSFTSEGISRDKTRCRRCQACVRCCPALAHEATGWETDVPTLMHELLKDLPFYEQSGGGVTFSGGEPLAQPGFLMEMLQACGKHDIHRAVDTSGFAPVETLMQIAAHTDLFLFDLKHMDSTAHQRFTGEPNEQILLNLSALANLGKPIRIRFPLVPGINADEENIRATGAFVSSLNGIDAIDVLAYQGAAKNKYARLGKKTAKEAAPPGTAEKTRAIEILEEYGLKVRLGG